MKTHIGNETMKKLSLGIQAFSKVINDNCVYVDKTEYIYNLIQGNCYFFARPRRFGKSLLCSTLEDLFLGNKELFKGLWIYEQSDFDWQKHPVIYIDFLLIAHKTPTELTESLMRYLDDSADNYDVGPLVHTTPGEMLKKLTIKLVKKYGGTQKVVLIIDEYDKAILEHIHDIKTAHVMREILKSFYEFIKGLDQYLRFVFITGVSKFSKTSIFSGLNQLVDISMDPRYAHLVGCTSEEINFFFEDHLDCSARKQELAPQELQDKLRIWYNGYRFWNDQPRGLRSSVDTEPARLYAPISILKCLDLSRFENYWFDTGTPTILLKLIEKNGYPVEQLGSLEASIQELTTFEPEHISLVTLLFQTGYITIKSYDEIKQNYIFDVPNQEVKDSLFNYILEYITKCARSTINTTLRELYDSLMHNQMDTFIVHMKLFYSSIPYTVVIEKEKYYQTIFYVILKLLNIKAEVEKATNIGRIDMVVETEKFLYIFEFKLNGSAQNALQQIYDTHYYQSYVKLGKQIVLVGITFSSKERNISDYLFEELMSKE
jgi:predicted AAA-ATPase/PD-(D/E)XK nuclease superfamily protein